MTSRPPCHLADRHTRTVSHARRVPSSRCLYGVDHDQRRPGVRAGSTLAREAGAMQCATAREHLLDRGRADVLAAGGWARERAAQAALTQSRKWSVA